MAIQASASFPRRIMLHGFLHGIDLVPSHTAQRLCLYFITIVSHQFPCLYLSQCVTQVALHDMRLKFCEAFLEK
jgi:hypothetical protein